MWLNRSTVELTYRDVRTDGLYELVPLFCHFAEAELLTEFILNNNKVHLPLSLIYIDGTERIPTTSTQTYTITYK